MHLVAESSLTSNDSADKLARPHAKTLLASFGDLKETCCVQPFPSPDQADRRVAFRSWVKRHVYIKRKEKIDITGRKQSSNFRQEPRHARAPSSGKEEERMRTEEREMKKGQCFFIRQLRYDHTLRAGNLGVTRGQPATGQAWLSRVTWLRSPRDAVLPK